MAYEGLRRGGAPRGAPPSWMGIPVKHISLIALTVQNSALILMLYYSRTMPQAGRQRYIGSTAVFLNEVFKLAACLTVALYEISQSLSSVPATSLFAALGAAVFTGDSWKLAIPATLYTLTNSLQYVAISNLEAATMQVTYQFKILPTAIFSVLLLRRTLSGRKWASLALLMLGLAIVQLPAGNSGPWTDAHPRMQLPRSVSDLRSWGNQAAARNVRKRSATYEGIEEDLLLSNPNRNESLGLAASVCACTAAALASVYFEKVLKDGTTAVSIWVRNVQLSTYSLFPALFIGVIFIDGETIAKNGFFVGYSWVVWTVIAFQALGGILVSLCVHYADNIAKSFAMSISILISLCASILLFDFKLTRTFVLGTTIVLVATYVYNSAAPDRARPPPIHVDFEKPSLLALETPPRDVMLQMPKSPRTEELRLGGTSTSRPGTPNPERRIGGKDRGYFEKRDA